MLYSTWPRACAAALFAIIAIAGCLDAAPEIETGAAEQAEYGDLICGDGVCEPPERLSCPADCDTPAIPCGDGFCRDHETWQTCPEDCDRP
jgi:hypothetical protein